MTDKRNRVNPYFATTKGVVDGGVSVNKADVTRSRDPKGDGQGFNAEGVTALVKAAEEKGGKLRPIF